MYLWQPVLDWCCPELIVNSSGLALDVKPNVLGNYTSHSFSNGKLAYKNDNDKYVAYINKNWIVSFIIFKNIS